MVKLFSGYCQEDLQSAYKQGLENGKFEVESKSMDLRQHHYDMGYNQALQDMAYDEFQKEALVEPNKETQEAMQEVLDSDKCKGIWVKNNDQSFIVECTDCKETHVKTTILSSTYKKHIGKTFSVNKDILNKYYNKKENPKYNLIGISGLAGSGKDELGKVLLEKLGTGWNRAAFADVPKRMLNTMGVSTDDDNKNGDGEYYGINVRKMMQTLGTEWGRGLDEDIWIKALKKHNPEGNYVITDVRMENEADFVRDNGGFIIHVKGRGGIEGNHESEQGIEFKKGDIFIFNNSDLHNLESQVSEVVINLVKD